MRAPPRLCPLRSTCASPFDWGCTAPPCSCALSCACAFFPSDSGLRPCAAADAFSPLFFADRFCSDGAPSFFDCACLFTGCAVSAFFSCLGCGLSDLVGLLSAVFTGGAVRSACAVGCAFSSSRSSVMRTFALRNSPPASTTSTFTSSRLAPSCLSPWLIASSIFFAVTSIVTFLTYLSPNGKYYRGCRVNKAATVPRP